MRDNIQNGETIFQISSDMNQALYTYECVIANRMAEVKDTLE